MAVAWAWPCMQGATECPYRLTQHAARGQSLLVAALYGSCARGTPRRWHPVAIPTAPRVLRQPPHWGGQLLRRRTPRRSTLPASQTSTASCLAPTRSGGPAMNVYEAVMGQHRPCSNLSAHACWPPPNNEVLLFHVNARACFTTSSTQTAILRHSIASNSLSCDQSRKLPAQAPSACKTMVQSIVRRRAPK
jgi:hypothetical protein